MAESDPHAPASPSPLLQLPGRVALVLQGGGALGAYQAGVYEALAEAAIKVDWVAGISIGAVNAAIIAGNAPAERVARLRSFWDLLSSALPALPLEGSKSWEEMVHLSSAAYVLSAGVPGFFNPRFIAPFLAPPGSIEAVSFYDTTPLVATLNAHVDWELLNSGATRLSVGAVNVATGNFRYFDTAEQRLDHRHILASGALPPGLPPVEIDGEWWWDGGLVSNTPLDWVLSGQSGDMLVFQVDLFPAEGARPATMADVLSREKDIRYSSRTRQVTDMLIQRRHAQEAARRLLAKLPADFADDPDALELGRLAADVGATHVVQLVYKARAFERAARDFEFSAGSMAHHWREGHAAVHATLDAGGDIIARDLRSGATATFDVNMPPPRRRRT